jgi:hypothetical protein
VLLDVGAGFLVRVAGEESVTVRPPGIAGGWDEAGRLVRCGRDAPEDSRSLRDDGDAGEGERSWMRPDMLCFGFLLKSG